MPYSDYGDVKDNKGVRNFSMFHGHFNLLEHFDFKPSPQIETKWLFYQFIGIDMIQTRASLYIWCYKFQIKKLQTLTTINTPNY